MPASLMAAPYTPAQFARELKNKIGNKRNASASTAASVFLRTALRDKRNKKYLNQYISRTASVLKSSIGSSFLVRSRVTLTRAINVGYFSNGQRYNARDSRYVSALRRLITSLPANRRNSTLTRQISGLAVAFSRTRGGTTDDLNFLTNLIYTTANQTPPPPLS